MPPWLDPSLVMSLGASVVTFTAAFVMVQAKVTDLTARMTEQERLRSDYVTKEVLALHLTNITSAVSAVQHSVEKSEIQLGQRIDAMAAQVHKLLERK